MIGKRDPVRDGWAAGQPVYAPLTERGRRCCVWCGRGVAHGEGAAFARGPAICDACAQTLLNAERLSLADFIEGLPQPVMVVSQDVIVEAANEKARAFTGKGLASVAGRRGGEVLECSFAGEPGGCGRTIHCSGCALRRAVEHTHATGEPLADVLTYHHIVRQDGIHSTWLRIHTERVGDVVLVGLDELGLERRA